MVREKQIGKDLDDRILTDSAAKKLTVNALFDNYMAARELLDMTRINYVSAVNNVIYNVIDAYSREEVKKAKKEHRKDELFSKISVHNLRHIACSNMAKRGMNIKVLQYIMGHAHSDVTMDVYNHLANKQDIKGEVERYAEAVGK